MSVYLAILSALVACAIMVVATVAVQYLWERGKATVKSVNEEFYTEPPEPTRRAVTVREYYDGSRQVFDENGMQIHGHPAERGPIT